MNKLKKAIVLVLALIMIITCTQNAFAATLGNNTSSNSASNSALNTTENEIEDIDEDSETEEENEISTTNAARTTYNTTQNTARQISSSNATENLPNTGIEDSGINLALVLLLALVFGIFSLIQYRKLIKNEE